MENSIVLAHAVLAVFFTLYLIIRLLNSLLRIRNQVYQDKLKARFRLADWIFLVGLGLTGMYPLIALGQVELYHLIKIILLGLIFWVFLFARNVNFAGATLFAMILVGWSGYSSFIDQPTFTKEIGAFEIEYPEFSKLPETEKGKFIFTKRCVECHGDDGRKGRFQAADLSKTELDGEQIVNVISNGSPLTVMRAFSKELSEREIEAVARYVSQLR